MGAPPAVLRRGPLSFGSPRRHPGRLMVVQLKSSHPELGLLLFGPSSVVKVLGKNDIGHDGLRPTTLLALGGQSPPASPVTRIPSLIHLAEPSRSLTGKPIPSDWPRTAPGDCSRVPSAECRVRPENRQIKLDIRRCPISYYRSWVNAAGMERPLSAPPSHVA